VVFFSLKIRKDNYINSEGQTGSKGKNYAGGVKFALGIIE
jgi:hypothetical protein